jgi:transcriptional regulator with XRE-family HTH domain
MRLQATIQDFRSHLGVFREQKGFSQQDLSRYSGLEVTYIQEIENGEAVPELIVLLTIADTLEIDVKGWFDY